MSSSCIHGGSREICKRCAQPKEELIWKKPSMGTILKDKELLYQNNIGSSEEKKEQVKLL